MECLNFHGPETKLSVILFHKATKNRKHEQNMGSLAAETLITSNNIKRCEKQEIFVNVIKHVFLFTYNTQFLFQNDVEVYIKFKKQKNFPPVISLCGFLVNWLELQHKFTDGNDLSARYQ